jgi:hypothetical protein
MVPVRELPVFSPTEYVTVPFPLPLSPELMVIQEALLAAVQLQSLVTLIEPVSVPPS